MSVEIFVKVVRRVEKWREEDERKKLENQEPGISKNQKKRDAKMMKKAQKKVDDEWVDEKKEKFKSKWL